ncbi:hypothetical protein DRO34_01440 [Candidatus Bathyarchaeota archaeon]|nr:MAG: hypothetical protein DRO34_01440 [Candidatus Bathyarchaeota archaeon]
MPIVRDALYWPQYLRERVRLLTQHFQEEELKRNRLATVKMRDVIIVCVAEALPEVEKMPFDVFVQKLRKVKNEKKRLWWRAFPKP